MFKRDITSCIRWTLDRFRRWPSNAILTLAIRPNSISSWLKTCCSIWRWGIYERPKSSSCTMWARIRVLSRPSLITTICPPKSFSSLMNLPSLISYTFWLLHSKGVCAFYMITYTKELIFNIFITLSHSYKTYQALLDAYRPILQRDTSLYAVCLLWDTFNNIFLRIVLKYKSQSFQGCWKLIKFLT